MISGGNSLCGCVWALDMRNPWIPWDQISDKADDHFGLRWRKLSQQKATRLLLRGRSDIWACLCPPLVCHHSSWYKTAPAKCGPTHSVPHMACGSCKVLGRPMVLSVVPVWMLILQRCTETLFLAGKTAFQSHSEVTESSESVRLFRHIPSEITASIFSYQIIICLMKKRKSFSIHAFFCETKWGKGVTT